MFLFAAFLHGTAVADVRRIFQLLALPALVIPTILSAVMLLTELTAAETSVLRFLGTEVFPQAFVEMDTVVARVSIPGDKNTVLFSLPGTRW